MDPDSQALWKDLIDTRRWERSDAFASRLDLHRDRSSSENRLNTGFYIAEVEALCAKELAARGEDWWESCREVLEAGQIAVTDQNIPQLQSLFAQEILKDHQAVFLALEKAAPSGAPKTGAGGSLETVKERGKALFRNHLGLTRLTQRSRVLRLEELLAAPRYEGVLKSWREAGEAASTDPNGAIRAAVSALEGAAKLLVRKQSATLGDVLGELRRAGRVAVLLLDAIEKVWAFSNATAGVRHGSAAPADIIQAESQFCLETTGSALRVMLVLDRPT